MDWRKSLSMAALLAALALFGALQFGHLGHPLFWQDEAETAMFARRILEHGYPAVRGSEGIVYGVNAPLSLGMREPSGAYLGSLWGQYYFAAAASLWADGAEDPHDRTARLRLVFAMAGCLGLWLFYGAVAPVLGRSRSERLVPATLFTLLLCGSVSLILHLREVRYYALAVLLVGACVAVELRQRRSSTEGSRPATLVQTALLVGLFATFYPAWGAVSAWLVLEALLATRGSQFSLARRSVLAASRSAPVWASLLAVVPLAIFFRLDEMSGLFSARWSFGPASLVDNLLLVCGHFTRFGILVPVLMSRFAVWVVTRSNVARADPRLRESASLARLGLLYALVGAANPIFFERYFVPLVPVLILVFVLDVSLLASLAVQPRGASRRTAARVGVGFSSVALLIAGWPQLPDISGRFAEISEPYRGPLDVAVPHLQERAGRGSLLIATNYEAESFMYYLGSHVIGRDRGGVVDADPELRPDVLIPRAAQPGVARVRSYLRSGAFERTVFQIPDLPYNNIPELSAGRVLRATHRFRTSEPAPGVANLVLYERVNQGLESRAHE